jgi:hypothetical protein
MDHPATKGTVKFSRNDRGLLYYFVDTRNVYPANNPLALSLTNAPVTLDINIARCLLGHPGTKTVTAMAAEHGWTLTGTVKPCKPCGSCALTKDRAKAIPRSTMTKATKPPGEGLFWDILGPHLDSLHQTKYWLKIVDDYMQYSWDCFLPRRSGFHVLLLKFIIMNKVSGKPCKYLRCDNAGENESYVQQVCAESNIQLEILILLSRFMGSGNGYFLLQVEIMLSSLCTVYTFCWLLKVFYGRKP